MIDLVSFIAIILVNIIMKQSEAYPEMVNSFVSIDLMFCVFANFFIFILKNKVTSIKKRYIMMCGLYIILMIDCILASFYFSYYLINTIFRIFAVIFIYSSFLISFFITKLGELKLSKNYGFEKEEKIKSGISYGNTYKHFIILEFIILILLTISDISISTKIMMIHPWVLNLEIFLFGILAIANMIRQWFEPYWYHKKILFIRLARLADEHIMDKAVIPPQREIETDEILHEVKYVLDRSFIRPLEINRLTKQLHDMMIKKCYEKMVAVNYCAMWSQTMITNLMKRKYDFSYMPNFILKIFQHYKKYKDNQRSDL